MNLKVLMMVSLLLQAGPGVAQEAAAGVACPGARLLEADASRHARLLALSTELLDAGKRLPSAGLPEALPADTVRVMTQALRMDLVRRTVYASCDGLWLWVLDSGGLADTSRWYGPLRSAALPPLPPG